MAMRRPARILFVSGLVAGLAALAAPGQAAGLSRPSGRTVSPAKTGRSLLTGTLSEAALRPVLLSPDAWHPYPKASEREAWLELPEAVRSGYIRAGEKLLGGEWPTPKASVFLDYIRDGNRSRFEEISFSRRSRLAAFVLAECAEGRGRFLDDIADGIWTIGEETFWGVPAHVSAQKRGAGLADVTEPVVDLFAAETGMLLAWTDYLLGDKLDAVSPLLRERIRVETRRRILNPCLERDDFWWMGFGGRLVNNWNPWICSNWLAAALLLEDDPLRRVRAVFKVMRCLDNFLDPYPDDGGCDEGPGYWDRAGGSLFDCLELLAGATGGAVNVFDRPLIREIGLYIARAYIADRWFINFADASAVLSPSASLIYRFGRAVHEETLSGFGSFLARRQGLGTDAVRGSFGWLGRVLPALFSLNELSAAAASEPLLRDIWMPGLQVMAARSFAGSTRGLYLAAKGGHNAESHNHNDVGSFLVYDDGSPVLIDVGVESYTAKTFSAGRYEIWTMQSAYHNLPTINGALQKDGRAFAARDVRYRADDRVAELSLDIAGAYPKEAGVRSWTRVLRLERGNRVVVTDRYELEAAAKPVRWTFMTCRRPELAAAGIIHLAGDSADAGGRAVDLLYDGRALEAAIEPIEIRDDHLKSTWGKRLYRVLLTARAATSRARRTFILQAAR
jgi:hypothetical protein